MVSDRQVQVLAKIVEKPRQWKEIHEIMDVSEASIGRYLNNLTDEGVIKKGYSEKRDAVVYKPVTEEIKNHPEYSGIIEQVKEENRIGEALIEHGFDSEGVDEDDILEFMKNHQEFFSNLSKPQINIDEADRLTLEHLKIFLNALEILTGGESKTATVEVNLKSGSQLSDMMPDVERFEELFEE